MLIHYYLADGSPAADVFIADRTYSLLVTAESEDGTAPSLGSVLHFEGLSNVGPAQGYEVTGLEKIGRLGEEEFDIRVYLSLYQPEDEPV